MASFQEWINKRFVAVCKYNASEMVPSEFVFDSVAFEIAFFHYACCVATLLAAAS